MPLMLQSQVMYLIKKKPLKDRLNFLNPTERKRFEKWYNLHYYAMIERVMREDKRLRETFIKERVMYDYHAQNQYPLQVVHDFDKECEQWLEEEVARAITEKEYRMTEKRRQNKIATSDKLLQQLRKRFPHLIETIKPVEPVVSTAPILRDEDSEDSDLQAVDDYVGDDDPPVQTTGAQTDEADLTREGEQSSFEALLDSPTNQQHQTLPEQEERGEEAREERETVTEQPHTNIVIDREVTHVTHTPLPIPMDVSVTVTQAVDDLPTEGQGDQTINENEMMNVDELINKAGAGVEGQEEPRTAEQPAEQIKQGSQSQDQETGQQTEIGQTATPAATIEEQAGGSRKDKGKAHVTEPEPPVIREKEP